MARCAPGVGGGVGAVLAVTALLTIGGQRIGFPLNETSPLGQVRANGEAKRLHLHRLRRRDEDKITHCSSAARIAYFYLVLGTHIHPTVLYNFKTKRWHTNLQSITLGNRWVFALRCKCACHVLLCYVRDGIQGPSPWQ